MTRQLEIPFAKMGVEQVWGGNQECSFGDEEALLASWFYKLLYWSLHGCAMFIEKNRNWLDKPHAL